MGTSKTVGTSSGYHTREGQSSQLRLNPSSCEVGFDQVNQDEGHGSREGIAAIGKPFYRQRDAGYFYLTQLDESSLISSMETMSIRSNNTQGYGQEEVILTQIMTTLQVLAIATSYLNSHHRLMRCIHQ